MRILAAPVLLLASGCVTDDIGFGGIGAGARNVTVVSEPPGAVLTVEGAGECETPCVVRLDGSKKARLAKAGFVAMNVVLTPDKRTIAIPLELAAPSGDVDSTALPELD